MSSIDLLAARHCCIQGIQAVAASTAIEYAYTIKAIVGNGNPSTLAVNKAALEASIGQPFGIAQSKNGDLFIALSSNHVVLKVEFNKNDGTSLVKIIAGTGSLGRGGENMPATQSALYRPIAITLIEDTNGEVTAMLIVEGSNHRVRKMDMASGIINTIAGGGGQKIDGIQATEFSLNGPYYAYYDKSTGNIFIAETFGNKIRRVNAIDGTITTVFGTCTVSGGGNGDGGLAVDACLNGPQFLTMNEDGEWFIVENVANVIRKVGLDGKIETVAGGGESMGDAPAKEVMLSSPRFAALTPSGELLVADFYGGRIRKLDKNGFMRVIAGGGTVVSGQLTPAKTASLKPSSVIYARDGTDDILIGDHNGYIMKLSIVECSGVKANSASACSGHGSCIGTDQCQCNDGWSGSDCSITHCFGFTSNHPNVCSGHGKCVKPYECHCDVGHRGHHCHR